MIKSLTPDTIQVSGNPAKWLQGHTHSVRNDLRLLMAFFPVYMKLWRRKV